MKRLVVVVLIGLCGLIEFGCIAVAKNNRISTGREVVAVDGRVYVIDKQCGTAREVDLSKATSFEFDASSDSDDD